MSRTDKGGRRCSSPAGRTATESQKPQARNTKDDLEDALSDLNRSTNRLRRKFDPTDGKLTSPIPSYRVSGQPLPLPTAWLTLNPKVGHFDENIAHRHCTA